MDNESTHMGDEVRELIEDVGAMLLCTTPYLPDLNPIENLFNIYKTYLRQHETEFNCDWANTH